MTSRTDDEFLEIAETAVREAATLCRAVRARLDPGVLDKRDLSPVTVADFGSQALVCRHLLAECPELPVVGEEDSEELRLDVNVSLRDAVLQHVQAQVPDADLESVLRWIDLGAASADVPAFWTLDPIDGTKGFLRNEQYAIALALIVGGEVRVAALACPNLPISEDGPVGVVFTAVRGRGATARPLGSDAPAFLVHASPNPVPADARFCESVESGHSAHGPAAEIAARLGITAPPVRLDSQAKYAVVARGEADIYLRLPTRADYREKIWDHAAGALVVAEAGGVVTDVDGKPLDFTLGRALESNRGVIVTNGRLHDRVLAAVREVGV